MALISTGIDKVRVFELPCAIWADGSNVGLPRVVLLKWWSGWCDKFHQIYVNGEYAGVTFDNVQRQTVIQIPTSSEYPVRIEVFAVEANQADTDFSSEIASPNCQTGRVGITMLRGQNLPIGATSQVYFDNGSGEMDYDKPLNNLPIRIWPSWWDKAGLGMCGFGTSDFGFDSAVAVGFGKGSFGHGEFGLGADTVEWTSPPMPAGAYRFGVKVSDKSGNESGGSETDQVTVTPAARPAEHVTITSFDKQSNQLVLSVA